MKNLWIILTRKSFKF